jgi:Nucleotidyl transferase
VYLSSGLQDGLPRHRDRMRIVTHTSLTGPSASHHRKSRSTNHKMHNEPPHRAREAPVQVDTTVLGCTPEEAKQRPYIASMGIYVFKRAVLCNLLSSNPEHLDFGGDVIPAAQASGAPLHSLPELQHGAGCT